MSLVSQVSALATRLATEFNDVRSEVAASLAGKADTSALAAKATDSAVVHLAGAETVSGVKTFSAAPSVPAPSAAGNPIRHDDSRLSNARTPTAHKTTHATGGTDALAPADIGAAASVHAHAGADITSGTVAYARLPVGVTASTVAAGDDIRLSNPRTPTAHASSHATGSTDPLSPAAIGAAASVHTHAASDVASGTLNAARLPLVPSPPVTLTYAATLAVDANAGNLRTCALTGNVTSWSITNGADGQRVLVWFTATSARAVDLSGLSKLSFIDDTLPVDSTTPGAVGLLRVSGTWYVMAAGAVG
jgi:hypothetical protein